MTPSIRTVETARAALEPKVSRHRLCVVSGVDPSVYSKAINGKRGVRDRTLEKLVAGLERLKREQRDLAMRLADLTTKERNAA